MSGGGKYPYAVSSSNIPGETVGGKRKRKRVREKSEERMIT